MWCDDLLANPVSDILIINSSYRECNLSLFWKTADKVPYSKTILQKVLVKTCDQYRWPNVFKILLKSLLLSNMQTSNFGKDLGEPIWHQWQVFNKSRFCHHRPQLDKGHWQKWRFHKSSSLNLIYHNILALKLVTLNISHKIECWIIKTTGDCTTRKVVERSQLEPPCIRSYQKTADKFHFLRQLKRATFPAKDLFKSECQ